MALDKVVSRARETRPFVLSVKTGATVRRDLARAVIDASGTWSTPNPLGANGLPADGESGIASNGSPTAFPTFSAATGTAYAGVTTLVIGSGHSAGNALLDLVKLAETEPRTSVIWATRGTNLARIFSGGDSDQLPARGELGANVKELVDRDRVNLRTGFAVLALDTRERQD